MCGIAGIAGLHEPDSGSGAIRAMTDAIAHRGPDAEGFYEEAPCFLGHRRLSILDLNPRGNQPMADHSGRYRIIFNGEVYNFKQLRAELQDYPFRTETDTEVILALWIREGQAAFSRFNGMFALAILNRETGELVLARDRMGIKPLYYAVQDGVLYFASEIRSLLASGRLPRKLNRRKLGDYLAFQTVSGEETLVQGVKLLPAGSSATFAGGALKVQTYWNFTENYDESVRERSFEELKSGVRERLSAAVERRMIADVPLGAFLSGGIDSSAVVALMAQCSTQPVETFSIGFREKKLDESKWAQIVAQKYKTSHHAILLKPEVFLDELENALSAMDHPTGDGVNSYVVSKVTREQGVKVALSGLGGDELFAGYPFFTRMSRLQSKAWLRAMPAFLRRAAVSGATLYPGGRRGQKLIDIFALPKLDLHEVMPESRRLYTRKQTARFLPPADRELSSEAWFAQEAEHLKKLPLLGRISAAEIVNYMQPVLLRDTDQMSMAHALEVRVPFLDHELVEYLTAIPDVHRYPHYPKKLLVDAMGDLLPKEIVFREKMGFDFPLAHWLRNELKDFAGQRMQSLAERGVFPEKETLRIWERFQSGDKHLIWGHVWVLMVLEDWMEKNGIEA